MLAPSARIWGYETNFGSFGQFTVAQAHQCLPKAPQLAWEEAAAATLVGTTAYRMLHGWPPNTLRDGEPVLVWGGSGGLGTQAIQLAVAAGATLLSPPLVKPWGQTVAYVRCPDGTLVELCTPVG